MPFKSESIGSGGRNWSVTVKTIQDLDADKSGDVIYAEGTCYLFFQASPTSPRIVNNEITVNNRCIEIINNRPAFIKGRIIYRQADSANCLRDILNKLILTGSQNT